MNAVNLILRDVAELDYAGFEGDLMMVTPDDLKEIVERHLAERSLSSVGAAGTVLSEVTPWKQRQYGSYTPDMVLSDRECLSLAKDEISELRAILAAAAPAPTTAQQLMDGEPEAHKLARILMGMVAGVEDYTPAEIYKDGYSCSDGDVFVHRAADLLAEQAAEIAELVRHIDNITDIYAAAQAPATHADLIADVILNLIHAQHELNWFEGEDPFVSDEHEKDYLVDIVSKALGSQAPAQVDGRDAAIGLAYGYLWHIGAAIDAPPECRVLSLLPQEAARRARKALFDLITHDQRGEGIRASMAAMSSPSNCPDNEGGEPAQAPVSGDGSGLALPPISNVERIAPARAMCEVCADTGLTFGKRCECGSAHQTTRAGAARRA